MNNILNLYNIELKRIYKLYVALLGFLVVGNIGIVIKSLNDIMIQVGSRTNSRATIGLLKSQETRSILFSYELSNIQRFTSMLLGLVVIFCLIYALVIWYRDFIGKSKTGYILFMLPNNKFNIYIAKAITIAVMIYGVIITQILSWIVDINIIKFMSNINSSEIINMFTGVSVRGSFELRLIQPHLIDFLMINVIGVILAVVVIFTGVMIQKSFKKIGVILGVLYIVMSIVIYILTFTYSNYSDQLLAIHIAYYIVLFATSIGISYKLLNKKVYV